MPFTMDAANRVDDLARAAVYLIDSEDIRSMTVRKLAAVAKASPSALIAHFENKERMLVLITRRIGDWVADAIAAAARERGSAGVLPDEALLPVVRAWFGLTELARSNDVLGTHFAAAQDQVEEAVCAAFCLDDEDVVTGQTLAALVTGLWVGMCACTEPMPYEHALTILRRLCSRIGIPFQAGPYGRIA